MCFCFVYFLRIAFIDFDTVEVAQSVMKKFNGKSFEGRQMSIVFAETRDGGKLKFRMCT